MNYSSRFWLYAPLCLFLILAAGVAVHWWRAASAFDKKLDAMKGHDAVPGIVIDWQAKTLSGFPFRLDVVFGRLSVKGAGAHGPFAWTSDQFALHALTYGRAKTVFEAAGRQHVAWTGADGAPHDVDFLPGSLHASSVMGSKGLAGFDLDIADAVGKSLAAGRFQFHMRHDPDGHSLDLMLRADEVRGLGAPRKLMQAYAVLSNAPAMAPLLRGEARWPDAARDWRLRGGTVRLSQVAAPDLAPDALLSSLY